MPVRKLSREAFLTLLIAALVLAGCNVGATPAPTIDVNAINTAAVATAMGQLSAQLTETALAAPSPTPLPTDTPASIPSVALPTLGNTSPTVNAGALPTLSFNTTPLGSTPIAGFTQLASPAAPAATAVLGDACNNNVFEGDVTIPDGSIVKPGEDFVKQWAIRNTGNCTWDEGYSLKIINSTPDCQAMDAVNFTFKKSEDFVSPGESINIGVNLTAPLKPATYQCSWKMQNDQGFWFGTPLTVVFEVRK
ncbi:MAG TPA: NBR1-Ig-like domain-containing protein [Anaerolineales bacterium]|nr:NBR1-Ig-like domain-containing protein [Anaerolineales bacterium]